MFLDINEIGADPLSFDRTLSLARVSEGYPDLLAAPEVRLHGSVSAGPNYGRPAEGATLIAHLEGRLQLRCCRCLEPFEQALATDFRFTLRSEAPVVEDPDHPLDPAETGFLEIEEGRLELDAVAAEQVYLNLPQKPLCEPSCAGLCPTCGSNRNRLECDCREETLDLRLQALRQIRDKMGRSRG